MFNQYVNIPRNFSKSVETSLSHPFIYRGRRTTGTNYRPIYVLPFFCQKNSEKGVASYVSDFFDDNNLFYKYQFCFRKGHSIRHAIITLVERVSKALDTGTYVVGVFSDLKKAFDTIDHGILVEIVPLWHQRPYLQLVRK